jgi:hypothetical protein
LASGTLARADATVSANPADWTPRITTGVAAYKVKHYGDTVYVGGDFTQVTDRHGQVFDRPYVFAFNDQTGEVEPFDVPTLDGDVWGIAKDPATGTIVLAGKFNHPGHKAIRVDPVTGNPDPAFKPALDGNVREAAITAGHLILAGEFTARITSLHPDTGRSDGYMRNVHITGDVDGAGGWTPRVYRFDIAAGHLAAIGNLARVNGYARGQAFVLNLGPNTASLNGWRYPPLWQADCNPNILDHLRGVAWSPDGSNFVIGASGGSPVTMKGRAVCDGVARFRLATAHPTAPVWVNYTHGDTVHSVAWAAGAVYAQGHFRHLDDGAVSRLGIGAIDPVTGKALGWNPGKDRGTGGKDLLADGSGLWVASDTVHIAGEVHDRIALLP